jgi:RNase P protein component
MHSSSLRRTDFKITQGGEAIPHADLFSSFLDTDRVGIVVPRRFEGIGAITLIMAYVTAFYDRYRERGPEFYAYPDFFTFQREAPCADYGMFDIWPNHKNVHVPRSAQQTAEAITGRGVNVLLVPDTDAREVAISAVERESARRNVQRCFAYSESGTAASSDLVIECRSELLQDYALSVLDSVPADDAVLEQRRQWEARLASDTLRQTFHELDLDDALRRL